ncbi:hypothetical protein DFH09DRAFT_56087 [Mycena vulgaris]|nr:hypothetical protein DFH09DRAFT_56087 [Mycena vulgaris]
MRIRFLPTWSHVWPSPLLEAPAPRRRRPHCPLSPALARSAARAPTPVRGSIVIMHAPSTPSLPRAPSTPPPPARRSPTPSASALGSPRDPPYHEGDYPHSNQGSPSPETACRAASFSTPNPVQRRDWAGDTFVHAMHFSPPRACTPRLSSVDILISSRESPVLYGLVILLYGERPPFWSESALPSTTSSPRGVLPTRAARGSSGPALSSATARMGRHRSAQPSARDAGAVQRSARAKCFVLPFSEKDTAPGLYTLVRQRISPGPGPIRHPPAPHRVHSYPLVTAPEARQLSTDILKRLCYR